MSSGTTSRPDLRWTLGSVTALLLGCSGSPAAPSHEVQRRGTTAQVALKPDGATIPVGDSVQMEASTLPPRETVWLWSVSDGSRASITPDGLLHALHAGDVLVRACTPLPEQTCGEAPLFFR